MNNKTTYINLNEYVEKIDESYFDGSAAAAQINDPIRFFSKNFWTLDGDSIKKASTSDNKVFNMYQSDAYTLTLVADKTKFLESESGNFMNKVFSRHLWLKFTDNLTNYYNINFFNNSFIFDHPITTKASSIEEQNTNLLKASNNYNFFCSDYEELAANKLLDVRSLPDIFSIIDNTDNINDFEEQKSYKLSYSGLISDELCNSLLISNKFNDKLVDYFNTIAKIYNTQENEPNIEILKNLNEEILIKKQTLKKINNLNYIPYPFHIDIKFKNKSKDINDFKDILNALPECKKELLQFLSNEETIKNDYEYIKSDSINIANKIKVFSLKDWLQNGLRDINYTRSEELSVLDTNYRPYRHVEYTSIVEHIKKNILPKVKSYQGFLNKEKEPEVLFYKIVKKQFSHDSDAIVQTIWIDPDDSEFIKHIDTQLKYSNEYYYNIYAYVLNIGLQYSYSDYYSNQTEIIKLNDLEQGLFKININSRPTYDICEVQIGKVSGICSQQAFVEPKVNFFKQDNRLAIKFLNEISNKKQKYKIIEDEDFNKFETIKKFQKADDLFLDFFSNQESNKKIEIYKTTVKPTNYMSFQGKKYKTVNLKNTDTIYDNILPGIKYYYIFRYLNNHDSPSNPSLIYEIEFSDLDGYISLVTNIINVEEKISLKTDKKMKRYLLIRPSLNQLQIKQENLLYNIQDVDLGPNGPKIWDNKNKNFILRITSKNSKRVIEFNLNSIINRKNK